MNPPLSRTNVTIRLTPCRSCDKGRLLWSRLDAGGRDGALVTRVMDQKAALKMLDLLRRAGRETQMLSAKQTPAEQARGISWFVGAERPALVVSENVPLPERTDIRQCYVMNLPATLAQAEADLAAVGRDRLDADAEFFASRNDIGVQSVRAGESKTALEALYQTVTWLENDGCARQYLAFALHDRQTGPCGNCGWCLGKKGGLLPPEG